MTYSNKHKQFLHYFMHSRMVSEVDAKKLNHALFANHDIDSTIELVNSKISPLEFKINRVVCEQNGDSDYVFVATFVNDFNAKRDPNKELFAELVDYIITSGGSVPYDKAIQFNSQMSSTQLDIFFTHKYLIADKHKNIFLSPLAINELEPYLTEKCVDRRCSGCLNVVIYGVQCNSCKTFAHGHCLNRYYLCVGSEKCPKCSKQLCFKYNPLIVFNQF